MSERFTLDEDAARAWLARGIALHDTGEGEEGPEDALPDIGSDYCAAMDEDGSDTFLLVSNAIDAGILADAEYPAGDTHSPSLVFEFIPDGDGDGYRWLLYGQGGEPIIASWCEGMNGLGGSYENRGAESALEVLREAVTYGNELAAKRAAQATDAATLDSLANMLRSAKYHDDATTLSEIAAIVAATGRQVEQ